MKITRKCNHKKRQIKEMIVSRGNIMTFIFLGFSTFITACASDSNSTSRNTNAPTGEECRNFAVLGSKMKKRYCATPEQWASYDAEAEEGAESLLKYYEMLSGVVNTEGARLP